MTQTAKKIMGQTRAPSKGHFTEQAEILHECELPEIESMKLFLELQGSVPMKYE